ncbi:MAG TPA: glycoside hydrolase family 13 protein [Bacteroidetes bacterium]|nr:glycoside hydrolase family 13 protein [Bacteroidota bacterium]
MILSGLLACRSTGQKNEMKSNLDWAKGAVWYQIFPERFCNGSAADDPVVAEVPETDNPHWRISPWTSDWYRMQPWEKEQKKPFYDGSVVFARRYGGDLIGVMEKLDYLSELGIDAIYFNPVFEAASLHKYDGSTFHHIDDNFGPDPVADKKKLTSACETEAPATWVWTKADSLFLQLIREAHSRGIKIVIDGVFNHTGREFFAFADILKHGRKSKYADWYEIERWDDPATPQNEFSYKGWWGVKSLPEFAEDENGLVAGPRNYVFAATKRWLDPNGDGDPSDGIDGWRLDVAGDVAPPFWRDWYTLVKSINPGAITVAEIWNDASGWIKDKRMDDTMNYLFAYAVTDFFIDRRTAISGSEFVRKLEKIISLYGEKRALILWNLIDSHDTDRLASMIINPDRDYDRNNGLRDNPNYDVRKPNNIERKIQKQVAAFQMMFIGAPVVYYGDEAGMWGADDPDDRKPMLWPEMKYDVEKSHPIPGKFRPADKNVFDRDLFAFYKKMIAIHRNNPALKKGDLAFLSELTQPDLIAFSRYADSQQAIVLFNRSDAEVSVKIAKDRLQSSRYLNLMDEKRIDAENGITIKIPARWFVMLGTL